MGQKNPITKIILSYLNSHNTTSFILQHNIDPSIKFTFNALNHEHRDTQKYLHYLKTLCPNMTIIGRRLHESTTLYLQYKHIKIINSSCVDLCVLRPYHNLKILEIDGCPNLTSLGSLTFLPHLTKLKIQNSNKINYDTLPYLAHLKFLQIDTCYLISSKLFTNLPLLKYIFIRRLTFSHKLNNININDFSQCPLLRTLMLPHCPVIGTESLSKLTNLKKLELRNINETFNFNSLTKCKKINHLTLRRTLGHLFTQPESLYHLKHLQVLSIPNSMITIDLSLISKCSKLQLLDIGDKNYTHISTTTTTPTFNKLRLLRLNLNQFESLDFHHKIKNLTLLSLNSCTSTTLDFSHGFDHLIRLDIEDCPNLTTIHGLKHIQLLSLTKCDKITTLNNLNIHTMRKIYIEECHNITCIDALCDLPNLSHIHLKKCNSLKNVNSLEKCINLQSLRISPSILNNNLRGILERKRIVIYH